MMLRQLHMSLRVAAALTLFVVVNSTAAVADCRGEVEATIQKIDTPDRPSRSEMIAGRYRETTEFIPPDRMRKIADSSYWIERIVIYLTGAGPFETIQIGDRRWERIEKKWVEYGSARNPLWKKPSAQPLPSDTTFACLGAVAFEATIYTGYQISFRPTTVMAVMSGTSVSKVQGEEALKALKEAPRRWRTILVDQETQLPVYDIMTPTSQLDSPTSTTHYTYPRDLAIEPPVQ
jgi:hypothetical protein